MIFFFIIFINLNFDNLKYPMIVEEILDGIEGFGEYANMYQEIFNVIDNLVLKY